PSRLVASRARSMSKPTSWFFSSRKPIGGKLSSRPTTILRTSAVAGAADLAVSVVSLLGPQAVRSTVAEARKIPVSFFIDSRVQCTKSQGGAVNGGQDEGSIIST